MSTIDVKAEVHLRPYQVSAVQEIERARERVRRLVVVAPTGAGKTVIIGRVVADAVVRGEGVLVIAHRRELIQQTYAKLVDAGLAEGQIGVLMSTDARRRPSAPVQVASIDTLRRRAKPPASVVIVDEAHRELARSIADVRAAYPEAYHLGFTATPYRADNRGLGEFYEELFVVTTIRELIADGHLVEPRVLTVPKGALPKLEGVRVRAGDYDQKDLEAAVDQQQLVGNIVEHWKLHAGGVRTVAFAVSVKHSRNIAERFREAGVPAEHLDGTTPTVDRDAILGRLHRGETRVVSNCGVLCEGWDQPSVKCAILARPTKSTGLFLQQAGRILRPWSDSVTGDCPRALILDHAGCAREHGLPQEDREFSLEAKEKKKRNQPALPTTRQCDGCHAVLPVLTKICPECGFFFTEPRAVPEEAEGTLVEAKDGDDVKARPEKPGRARVRESWDRAMQRTVFEQYRALARTKRLHGAWAIEKFKGRYGAPPPPEWVADAWGTL